MSAIAGAATVMAYEIVAVEAEARAGAHESRLPALCTR
jgi:hypothetical protein